jgi:hypothetical protein
MRHAFSILLAALACSCVLPGTSGGAGAGSTGTGGGGGDTGVCKTTATCADCTTCALNGPCASLYSSCEADPACSGLDQCFGLCAGDPTCKSDCLASNPDGASAYSTLLKCVNCDQCSSQCAGQCS